MSRIPAVDATTDHMREPRQECSTLDLIRRYLAADEEERLRQLEAAATAIQSKLTPDEVLRIVNELSRGVLELIAERRRTRAATGRE